MSIILDTRTQSTMKSVQYNGRQDPGGYWKQYNNVYIKMQTDIPFSNPTDNNVILLHNPSSNARIMM